MEIAKNAGITYKQTPVANGTLVKVIKAAMASHLEDEKGWNYYVSKSKEAIAELAESGENAAEVKDAPAVIVPVYAPAKETPTAEDVERSRAIGNMLVIMEEIGLAGIWVNVMDDEAQQKKVAEAMNISSEFMPMGILTLGYPEKDPDEDKPGKKKKKADERFRKKIHFVDTLGRY